MSAQFPWKRVVGEGVLIVGSILLAFAIDAAWAERQERIAERVLVAGLEEEFRFNLNRLDEFEDVLRMSRIQSEALLALSGPTAPPIEALAVDSLLYGATRWSTYDPSTGSIRQVLDGDLELIRSDRLRSELARWDEQRRDFREDEDYAVVEMRTGIGPYVRTRVPRVLDPNYRDEGVGQPRHLMLRDIEFGNLIAGRVGRTRYLEVEAADFRRYLEGMLAIIEADYGGR